MQVGEILKEQREEKNISLDDIQAETKIQKRYLVAIEENDFQALPGKFYARAFIKEYAYSVGLDPEEVLHDFDEKEIEPEEPATQYTRMDRSKRSKSLQGSSFWSFLPTIIVIILIIGIIFVAWALFVQKSDTTDDPEEEQTENNQIYRDSENNENSSSNNEQDEDNTEDAENTAPETTEDEESEDGEFEVVEEGTGNFPESKLDFTYSSDEVEVTFEVSDESYIELKGLTDDHTYLEKVLNPGEGNETYTVTDEDEVYFKVGNASGVTIYINDVELEYPIDTSTVTQKLLVDLQQE